MKGAAWKDEKGENTFTEELFDFLLFFSSIVILYNGNQTNEKANMVFQTWLQR